MFYGMNQALMRKKSIVTTDLGMGLDTDILTSV